MGTTFRPYQPDQMQLLPQDVREWVPEGHLAHHVSDLVDALDLSAFYAPYEGDGRRNSPYDPRMMVKVLVYGYATGTFSSRKLAKRLEEGRRVPDAGGGELSAAPDAVRVPPAPSGRFRGGVRRGGSRGAGDGPGGAGQGIGGRDEGPGQREQAQGDELRPDDPGGEAAASGDRGAAGGGRSGRHGRGRSLRRRRSRRRAAGGIEAARGPAGGDPGGDGAPGGRAESGGRRAGPQAGAEAQPEGRPALQAAPRRAGGEGAEQLHGPREPDHEDEFGGVPAVLQTRRRLWRGRTSWWWEPK